MAVSLRPSAPTAADAWATVVDELDRSRRYERPLGLVMITPAPMNGAAAELLRALQSWIRAIDHAWSDRGHFYVLLPEADRNACRAFLERIRLELPHFAQAEARHVVFPDDGLTGAALLAALAEQPPAGVVADARAPHTNARVARDGAATDASRA